MSILKEIKDYIFFLVLCFFCVIYIILDLFLSLINGHKEEKY